MDVRGQLHDGVVRGPVHSACVGQPEDDRVLAAVDDSVDERHDGDAVPQRTPASLLRGGLHVVAY